MSLKACCGHTQIRRVPKQIPLRSHHDSINIAGPNHDNFNSVLFHFNPRQFERGGQCVLNSKNKGTWGQAICIPMSTLPLIFGRPSYCKLSIQLSKAGFDIHLDNKHIARLEHRQEIRSGDCSLFLNFPATDDYGSEYSSTFTLPYSCILLLPKMMCFLSSAPEKWTVSNVWWGAKPLIAKCNASEIAGCTSMNLLHPVSQPFNSSCDRLGYFATNHRFLLESSLKQTKLFIRGLPKIHTSSQVDLRRAQLERAFRKYGGIRGVSVIAPKKVSFAFIELEFAEQAQAALREMAGLFNITHAKYTRLEALGAQKRATKAN